MTLSETLPFSLTRKSYAERDLTGRRDMGHFHIAALIWISSTTYILNQEKHHEKSTFKNEYLQFLEKYEIIHDGRFLFNFWDDV
jgi:hypothetical protein